jgi:hypothetical protein
MVASCRGQGRVSRLKGAAWSVLPVYEEPLYEEPLYEEPLYEEPLYEEPGAR